MNHSLEQLPLQMIKTLIRHYRDGNLTTEEFEKLSKEKLDFLKDSLYLSKNYSDSIETIYQCEKIIQKGTFYSYNAFVDHVI